MLQFTSKNIEQKWQQMVIWNHPVESQDLAAPALSMLTSSGKYSEHALALFHTIVQLGLSRVSALVDCGDDQYHNLNQTHDNHKTKISCLHVLIKEIKCDLMTVIENKP